MLNRKKISLFVTKLSRYLERNIWFAPPNYRFNLLNLVGLQVFRYGYEALRYRIKKSRWTCNSRAACADIHKSGMHIKNNFLEKDVFNNLKENVEKIVVRENNKEDSIIASFKDDIATRIVIDESYLNSGFGRLDNLAWNIWECIPCGEIEKYAEDVNKEKNNGAPYIEIEYISVPRSGVDHYDHNTWWHADRHFHCGKCFYFINDHYKENGTYEYFPSQYQSPWSRIYYEYVSSLRWTFRFIVNHFNLNKMVNNNIKKPRVSDYECQLLGLKPRPIEASENTLVVSDNFSFHRRGKLSPGTKRIQLNFIFYKTRKNLLFYYSYMFLRKLYNLTFSMLLKCRPAEISRCNSGFTKFTNEQGVTIHGKDTQTDKRFLAMSEYRYIKNKEYLLFKWACKQADHIFDVGSNYGQFSFGVYPLHDDQMLHVFEPNPRLFSSLEKTISENDIDLQRVIVNSAAVSEVSGSLSFAVNESWSGSSSLEVDGSESENTTMITVKAYSLDDYCIENHIDIKSKSVVIKIDVEGSDLKALYGAKEILSKCSSYLLIIELDGKQFINNNEAASFFESLFHSATFKCAIFTGAMYEIDSYDGLAAFFRRNAVGHVDVVLSSDSFNPIHSGVLFDR
ncbi:MAG: FkbM family methyltransferase [Candidatus Endobugula sp.]|jgi:FkbM family methyltransferase